MEPVLQARESVPLVCIEQTTADLGCTDFSMCWSSCSAVGLDGLSLSPGDLTTHGRATTWDF